MPLFMKFVTWRMPSPRLARATGSRSTWISRVSPPSSETSATSVTCDSLRCTLSSRISKALCGGRVEVKTIDMKERAFMSNFLTTGSSASSGRLAVLIRLATSTAASARSTSASNSTKTNDSPSREVLSILLLPCTWLIESSSGLVTRVSISSGPAPE